MADKPLFLSLPVSHSFMTSCLKTWGLFMFCGALALSAQANSQKRVKAHAVHFDVGATALLAERRQEIADYVESLRNTDWCPLVVVVVLAQSPASSSQAVAVQRAAYVENLLLLNGVPPEVLHAEAKQSPDHRTLVDIESLGILSQQDCPYPKDRHGFRANALDGQAKRRAQ